MGECEIDGWQERGGMRSGKGGDGVDRWAGRVDRWANDQMDG